MSLNGILGCLFGLFPLNVLSLLSAGKDINCITTHKDSAKLFAILSFTYVFSRAITRYQSNKWLIYSGLWLMICGLIFFLVDDILISHVLSKESYKALCHYGSISYLILLTVGCSLVQGNNNKYDYLVPLSLLFLPISLLFQDLFHWKHMHIIAIIMLSLCIISLLYSYTSHDDDDDIMKLNKHDRDDLLLRAPLLNQHDCHMHPSLDILSIRSLSFMLVTSVYTLRIACYIALFPIRYLSFLQKQHSLPEIVNHSDYNNSLDLWITIAALAGFECGLFFCYAWNISYDGLSQAHTFVSTLFLLFFPISLFMVDTVNMLLVELCAFFFISGIAYNLIQYELQVISESENYKLLHTLVLLFTSSALGTQLLIFKYFDIPWIAGGFLGPLDLVMFFCVLFGISYSFIVQNFKWHYNNSTRRLPVEYKSNGYNSNNHKNRSYSFDNNDFNEMHNSMGRIHT